MTDDRQLAALFRDAAGDPPPSGFDHDEVVATSRRITRRRRAAVLGGAMALLVVAGVGVAVAVPRAGGDDASTAAAPAMAPEAASPAPEAATPAPEAAAPAPEDAAPGADDLAPFGGPGDARKDQGAAEVPEAPRGDTPFAGPPLGPGTAACADRQDPELRALVEQVLPEVVGAPEAAVTALCHPPGERGVNLEVDDSGTPGLLTVLYLPPGAAPDLGYGGASAATASGGTVVVSSRPGGPTGAVPFEGRLDTAAAFLAPRL